MKNTLPISNTRKKMVQKRKFLPKCWISCIVWSYEGNLSYKETSSNFIEIHYKNAEEIMSLYTDLQRVTLAKWKNKWKNENPKCRTFNDLGLWINLNHSWKTISILQVSVNSTEAMWYLGDKVTSLNSLLNEIIRLQRES